jgi:hypothetical protein
LAFVSSLPIKSDWLSDKAKTMKTANCFLVSVRNKLWLDYGIRDIPSELLEYFVRKEKTKYERNINADDISFRAWDAATCAFLVANTWQRGLTQKATSEVAS